MSAPEIVLYPTPTRKKLCRDIDAGKVRWYRWIEKHWACNTAAGDRAVTADVRLLEHHGLAEILPLPDPRDSYSLVRLTDTGRVWAGIDHAAEGGATQSPSNSSSDVGGDAA